MTKLNVKDYVIDCFEEIGMYIDCDNDDINISQDLDSLAFLSLMISLEEKFNIQIPDEFYSIELLSSLNGLVELIYVLINDNPVD